MKFKRLYKPVLGFLMQLAAWGILIGIAPVIAYFAGGRPDDSAILLNLMMMIILPAVIVYFINYYLLVPLLFFKGKKIWFFMSEILLVLLSNIHFIRSIFSVDPNIPHYWVGIATAAAISVILEVSAIGVTIGVRNYQRTVAMRRQLAEETHRRTEAELMWLKNQLNPHFLFNSLNNISSLIWIDAEQAQNAIGELSDLLRYAIYESEKKYVPLQKELDFMQNYISLMSLRCNSKTTVHTSFEVEDRSVEIAPLLLISLVENAFKHGVSTSQSSFLNFRLTEKNHILTFVCENYDYHKRETDHSGSGIGVANMRKRLELIYPGRYYWKQDCNGEIFKVTVTIDLNKA